MKAKDNTDMVAEDVAERTGSTAEAIADAGSTVAAKAGDIAMSAKDALAEMRRILDDFAAASGESAGEAAEAVSQSTVRTVENVGALVGDARALGKDSLDTVAEKIAERPFTAMAVAAGVGIALGLMTRSGADR